MTPPAPQAPIHIVPLDTAWIEQVCDIENLCYVSPWSRQSLEYSLSGGYKVIGAFTGPQTLRGYIIYSQVGDESHILNVAVHPDYRRYGFGRALMSWLHRSERERGAKKMFLEVSRGNQAAQHLYEAFGYRQIGTRKAYYRDTRDDALVMTLELSGVAR